MRPVRKLMSLLLKTPAQNLAMASHVTENKSQWSHRPLWGALDTQLPPHTPLPTLQRAHLAQPHWTPPFCGLLKGVLPQSLCTCFCPAPPLPPPLGLCSKVTLLESPSSDYPYKSSSVVLPIPYVCIYVSVLLSFLSFFLFLLYFLLYLFLRYLLAPDTFYLFMVC